MKNLLSQAQEKNYEIEIYKSTTKSTTVEVRDQKVESIDTLFESGMSIRVIRDSKLGFAYSSDFDQAEDTLEQAISNSNKNTPDNNYVIPKDFPYSPLVTFDRAISSIDDKKKIQYALEIEKAAYASNKFVTKSEKVSFSTSETKIEILNSNGIDASYFSNHCGGSCDIIADDGKDQDSGFAILYTPDLREFDPKTLGSEAAARASELLSAKTIGSQKMALILDPLVGAQLLGAISSLFSADSVQKGKSLFANKLEKMVASSKITIIDDGRLKNGLFSAPIDDEGVPTQETKLLENGLLQKYLHNSYSAKKGQTVSTGNAKRSSYKSTPEVAASNLYIVAGQEHPNVLISSVAKGLYVTRVMGMHTINPISGDFSIGASGIVIENGQKTYPVRGLTIAGNLIDLLGSIDGIANDLRFFPFSANLGSPTLLVSNIAISG